MDFEIVAVFAKGGTLMSFEEYIYSVWGDGTIKEAYSANGCGGVKEVDSVPDSIEGFERVK